MHRWGPLALASLVAVLLTWLVVPPKPCSSVLPLAVTSSEEKSSLLVQLASDFERARPMVGNQCVDVTVSRKASGAAEQALARGWNEASDGPRPDAWLPAAITWILLLDHQRPNLAKPDSPSLFRSPLVIGMPREMAIKLGWPDQAIGWSEVLKLASNQTGWSTYGRPDWGAFQLGKTNPNTSTSGLHALIGTYFAASRKSRDLTSATLADPAVRAFVRGVENAVVHYGDSVSNFLLNLQAADDEGRALSYVSALAMEEKQIWDYNQGNPTGDPAKLGQHPLPKVPLVAIYPRDGTLAADHPYAVLNAPWVTPAKQQAAQAFLQYLERSDIQSRFQAAGFRDRRGTPGSVINQSNGMLPNQPGAYLELPTAAVISDVQTSWNELRKRARVLVVIDRSAFTADNDATKVAQSVDAGLTMLAGDDTAGAWSVPAAAGSNQPYAELVPLQSLEAHRAELRAAIAATRRSSERVALYRAVALAVAKLKTSQDPSRINAVLLVSAGRSSDPADVDRFSTLADLSAAASQVPGIHVFTVAYGNSPDRQVLRLVALAGKGAYYDASDPASVARALTAVTSNF
jgi:Ca-activated chloride channel homolog